MNVDNIVTWIIFDWIMNTDIYHHNKIMNIKFTMTIFQLKTFETERLEL